MIYVIGIGSEGSGSLSKGALSALRRSSVMMGAKRHTDIFPDFSGEVVGLKGGIEGALKKVERAVKGTGKHAAILATGDPLFFGIGKLVVERFGRRGLTVIPNVSIVQEAFARIKESHEGAVTVSVHGSGGGAGGKEGRDIDAAIERILAGEKAAVFTDPANTPKLIAKRLMERGAGGYTAYVLEALGTERERITRTSIKALAISRKKFDPLNILILVSTEGLRPAPSAFVPGLPDDSFYSPDGMMTKSEVRAVTISRLRPAPGEIVWDVGAGSGTVSIEAALGAPGASVIAIEKKAVRVRTIERNVKKFNAKNIEVVKGVAPEALKGLPRPDAIFVGGGGKSLQKILSYAARRLKPGGRIVINTVTAASLAAATEFFIGKKGWRWDTVAVSVERGRVLRGAVVADALNTINILRGFKT